MRPHAIAIAFVIAAAFASTAAAQSPHYEHAVYLHEYSGGLHVVPEQINAKVGDTLVLTVLNQGASSHNLRVCGDAPPSPSSECQQSWGQTKFNIAPNETVTLTIENIAKAGTFEYYCYVPGHKGGGMLGELVVQGASSGEKSGVPAIGVGAAIIAVILVAASRKRMN